MRLGRRIADRFRRRPFAGDGLRRPHREVVECRCRRHVPAKKDTGVFFGTVGVR